MRIIISWLFFSISILILSRILPGFRIKGFKTALIVAAVYGILHLLLYKILYIIAYIPIALTFGLFTFIINAFILYLTDKLIEDFEIKNFTTTIIASVLLSLINSFFRYILLP